MNKQQTKSTKATTHYQNKEIEDLLESNWISIKDGETRVLQFIPNKSKVVEKTDFIEDLWVGKKITIGSSEDNNIVLKVTSHCTRCVMITLPLSL